MRLVQHRMKKMDLACVGHFLIESKCFWWWYYSQLCIIFESQPHELLLSWFVMRSMCWVDLLSTYNYHGIGSIGWEHCQMMILLLSQLAYCSYNGHTSQCSLVAHYEHQCIPFGFCFCRVQEIKQLASILAHPYFAPYPMSIPTHKCFTKLSS
jgi:hypothetical protein